MIAEITKDEALIKSVVCIKEIFDLIAEDGFDSDSFELDAEKDCWIAIKDNDVLLGVYHLHPHNSATLEMHVHILPKYRKKYALQSGKTMLKWLLDECPVMYQKFIAQVPFLYPNVKDFCIKNGFTVEGVNRLSHRKHGELHNQWLLGMTRSEIEEFLR